MHLKKFGHWHFSGIAIAIATLMVWLSRLPQRDWIAALQKAGSSTSTHAMQFISDSITFFSFGVPIVIALIGETKEHKRTSRLSFLYVALSIGVAGLVSYLLKKTTSIPRPYEVDARIAQWSVGGGFSFPSGHTTEAFASALALTFLWRKWSVTTPMLIWASSVAFSRVYLGVHYPFDIMGGILIALSVTYFLKLVFERKTDIFTQP